MNDNGREVYMSDGAMSVLGYAATTVAAVSAILF